MKQLGLYVRVEPVLNRGLYGVDAAGTEPTPTQPRPNPDPNPTQHQLSPKLAASLSYNHMLRERN
jgi:hypothetical protein